MSLSHPSAAVLAVRFGPWGVKHQILNAECQQRGPPQGSKLPLTDGLHWNSSKAEQCPNFAFPGTTPQWEQGRTRRCPCLAGHSELPPQPGKGVDDALVPGQACW